MIKQPPSQLGPPDSLLADSLFVEAEARLPVLPRRQRELTQALLVEPEAFAFGSVREVSDKYGVNTATVLRFARSLGFSGYQALQDAVRLAYLRHTGLQVPEVSADEGLGALRDHHHRNLDRAYETASDLDSVCQALLRARRVIVTGESISTALAQLFVRMLRFANLRAEFVSASGVDRTIGLSDLDSRDLVVGFGLWLQFRPTLETMAIARRRGAVTVVISGSASSPLARHATYVLPAPAQGQALSFSVVPNVALMELIADQLVRFRRTAGHRDDEILHDRFVEENMLAPLVEKGGSESLSKP